MLGYGTLSPCTNTPECYEMISEQIIMQAQQYDKNIHDDTIYQLIAVISLTLIQELASALAYKILVLYLVHIRALMALFYGKMGLHSQYTLLQVSALKRLTLGITDTFYEQDQQNMCPDVNIRLKSSVYVCVRQHLKLNQIRRKPGSNPGVHSPHCSADLQNKCRVGNFRRSQTTFSYFSSIFSL